MKLSTASIALCVGAAQAFQPSSVVRRSSHDVAKSSLQMGFDLSGNTWKPDSETMGSTDTGDFFPDDYEAGVDFSEGMMGSQAKMGGDHAGPATPGMENFGAGADIRGGIEMASEIPAGMEFVMSSVPDGEFEISVPSSGSAKELALSVNPVCMSFEDYYAAFTPDSHPCFSIAPVAGRMNRRGGEPSAMTVTCNPNGQAGEFIGNLVINLPEDNSKICYKIVAKCY